MHQANHGGGAGNQSRRRPAQPAAPALQSASPSPTTAVYSAIPSLATAVLAAFPSTASAHQAQPVALTLNAAQTAKLLGYSERKFHELRHQPWMPKPIVLGPRMLRWVRSEVESALQRAPRQETIPEPPTSLAEGRRKRIERIKAGGAQ